MVKVMVILVLVATAILGVVYFAGGVSSFDPTKEGIEKKARIKPGMTWKQVLDIAGPPGKYQVYRREVKNPRTDEEYTVVVEGAEIAFDRKIFENDFKASQMPEGSRWLYHFSAQAAFGVDIDPAGKVASISDEKTTADLLGTRK